jgi:serine/threonine-protein kinase
MNAFAEGTVLRGKYRVERVLGKGGMGVVLSAWHPKRDQPVAIKVLLPAMLAHPEIVERFLREGRAASRLQSDHVVRIMDVDTLEDGAPYLVMEQLDGDDLSAVRKRRQPLGPHLAADYLLQTAEAIAEAHSLGIIHRDLKPANLFLAQRRDGTTRIKVLDFGISKVTSAEGSEEVDLTSAVAVMGSPTYMSPEQMLASRDVDARTDIWALGVILYELCTAQVPFPGKTVPEVCAMVMSVPPPPPRSLRPEIPEGLEGVILRCLRKDPAERFQTVMELRAALLPFRVATVGAATPSVATVSAPAPLPSTLVLPVAVASGPATEVLPGASVESAAPGASPGKTTAAVAAPIVVAPPARSSRAWVIAGVGALVIVGVGAGMMALNGRGKGEATPASPSAASSVSSVPPASASTSAEPSVVVVSASAAAPSAGASASSAPKVTAPLKGSKPAATSKPTGEVKGAPAPLPPVVPAPTGHGID